jgi:hypothetical protein
MSPGKESRIWNDRNSSPHGGGAPKGRRGRRASVGMVDRCTPAHPSAACASGPSVSPAGCHLPLRGEELRGADGPAGDFATVGGWEGGHRQIIRK